MASPPVPPVTVRLWLWPCSCAEHVSVSCRRLAAQDARRPLRASRAAGATKEQAASVQQLTAAAANVHRCSTAARLRRQWRPHRHP